MKATLKSIQFVRGINWMEIRLNWNSDRHHAVDVKHPCGQDQVIEALQDLANLVRNDYVLRLWSNAQRDSQPVVGKSGILNSPMGGIVMSFDRRLWPNGTKIKNNRIEGESLDHYIPDIWIGEEEKSDE